MKITSTFVYRLELFIVALIIFNSAKISFLTANIMKLPIMMLVLLLYYLKKKQVNLNGKLIIVPVILLWSIYLTLSFNVSYEYLIYISLIIQILLVYLIQDIIPKFWVHFCNIVYVLCIISLPFYCLQVASLSTLKQIIYAFDPINTALGLDASKSNILVFTYRKDFDFGPAFRNSGFGHEPGGFAIFILLAIFFSLLGNGFRLNKKINVMAITLITTMSTQGLMSLSIIFLLLLLNSKAFTNQAKAILLVLVIPIGAILYTQLDFLDNKIQSQMGAQLVSASYKEAYYDRITPGRFGSMLLDYNDFLQRPWFGYGLNDKTRFYNYSVEQQRTNGISDFLVKYGLIFSVIFFISIYNTNKNRFQLYRLKFSLIGFVFLLTLFFSQPLIFGSIASFMLLADFSRSRYMKVVYAPRQYKIVI